MDVSETLGLEMLTYNMYKQNQSLSVARLCKSTAVDAMCDIICGALLQNGRVLKVQMRNDEIMTREGGLGPREIAESLRSIPRITELDLSGCDVSDESFARLANAVALNSHITSLNLTGCNIRRAGLDALVNLLEGQPQVTSLKLDPSCFECLQHTGHVQLRAGAADLRKYLRLQCALDNKAKQLEMQRMHLRARIWMMARYETGAFAANGDVEGLILREFAKLCGAPMQLCERMQRTPCEFIRRMGVIASLVQIRKHHRKQGKSCRFELENQQVEQQQVKRCRRNNEEEVGLRLVIERSIEDPAGEGNLSIAETADKDVVDCDYESDGSCDRDSDSD